MKDLYDKNYYTPQLPMRTFRNPYFIPSSNQLLFDILNKQNKTATTTPIAPTTTTPPPPPVNPTTTGPQPQPTKPKPATKPAPQNPDHPHGTNKDGTPSKRRGRPRKIGEGVEDKAKADEIQKKFNKAVADQKARDKAKKDAKELADYLKRDEAERIREEKEEAKKGKTTSQSGGIKRNEGKTTSAPKKPTAPAKKPVAPAKKPADITSKPSSGSLFDYPPVPVFGRKTSPADRIAKLTAWQKATHQGYDPNVSDAQRLTKIKGDKMLKVAKEEQYNLRYKPLSTIPNTLADAQAALVNTKATEPRNNPRKSKDQQSPTWRRWNREKEDLEDKIKALTKSAAVKPIEKAGKEGKSTDLVDAAATGSKKPMKTAGYRVKATDYPNLQPTDRVFLNNQYRAWAGANKDIVKLRLAKIKNPSDTKTTKRIDSLQAVIRRAKKRIVTIEQRGGGRR